MTSHNTTIAVMANPIRPPGSLAPPVRTLSHVSGFTPISSHMLLRYMTGKLM